MKKAVCILALLIATHFTYGCGSQTSDSEQGKYAEQIGEWSQNKRDIEDFNKNYKSYEPPPNYERPPSWSPPQMPTNPRRFSMDSLDKENKITYLKSFIREYGGPNDVYKLNAAQKETLKAEIVEIKQRIKDWKEFDSREISTINLICDQYLSKLPR